MPADPSRRAALAIPALLLLGRAGRAAAQAEWAPTQTLRIVVPSTPGGTTDVMARLLGAHLQGLWSQSVVVENKAGAGGIVGTQDVLRSAPDGHTILMGNVGPQAIAYTLVKSMPYKPADLLPVSNMIFGPNVFAVNKDLPVATLAEFVEYARARPGQLNYGTPGLGQTPHLGGLWLNQLTGVRTQAVHYRGSGPAATDLLAGHLHFIVDALVNQIEPGRAGTVKLLAVTGAERYPLLPDVPTAGEAVPELRPMALGSWVGVFLRAGTPLPVVRRINADIRSLLEAPAARERFLGLGGLPAYGTPEAFGEFVRAEAAKYAAVISTAGLAGQVD